MHNEKLVVAGLASALLVAGLCAVSCAAKPSDEDVIDGPLGKQLHAHMMKRAGAGFSGVLLVAKDGKVVIAKEYGPADRERQIPFTSKTVFDIGSITKQFTGAAIAKLQMQGKLNADDRLSKYFPEVPADKSAITLYHLLTHSAALKGDFGGDYDTASREWLVGQALASKLLFEPGQGHHYSNAGFSLLAAVIEKVTGRSYESYLRESLWLPAGMKDTGYRLPKWDSNPIAHGYRGKTDCGTPLDKTWAEDGPYWNLRGNGGVLSTVWDLYRWHRALLDDDILSKDAKDRMFARRVKEGPKAKSWYSYGWTLRDSPRGTRVIEHNGGNGLFYADFVRYVDEGIVIIAASNRSEDAWGGYMRDITKAVFP
jgi:CubicO group peptidase (beta-lactamase class C family)